MALTPVLTDPSVPAAPPVEQRRQPRALGEQQPTPRVSVVIVNYGQWEATHRLVRQLQSAGAREAGLEVVVVDNHSGPHPLARELRRRDGLTLRRWERNRGFACAVNEGCWLSRGDWFLVLNPDLTLPEGFCTKLPTLLDQLESAHPRAGIAGLHLRNSDGSRQLSAGPFPTLLRTLAGLLLPRSRRKYHVQATHRRRRVPWVTGCCLLLKRGCFEELGGFDEDFFLYYEDVDLCRRARECGWSVWFEPGLRVIHHHPLHNRSVSAPVRVLTRHALLTYAGKHWPGWQLQVLGRIVAAEAWLRRHWARWRGDLDAAACFDELGAIVAELARRRTAVARRHLDRLVRREERRHAV